jgi:hypothetical protein
VPKTVNFASTSTIRRNAEEIFFIIAPRKKSFSVG